MEDTKIIESESFLAYNFYKLSNENVHKMGERGLGGVLLFGTPIRLLRQSFCE